MQRSHYIKSQQYIKSLQYIALDPKPPFNLILILDYTILTCSNTTMRPVCVLGGDGGGSTSVPSSSQSPFLVLGRSFIALPFMANLPISTPSDMTLNTRLFRPWELHEDEDKYEYVYMFGGRYYYGAYRR